MQLEWDGYYLDGQTAERHAATIEITPQDLHIKIEGRSLITWPLDEIRQTQGFYKGEHIRLEKDGEFPEAILLTDPTFLTTLHRVATSRASHFHRPIYRTQLKSRALLAAVASVILLLGLYMWGIPAMARVATAYVPTSWETQLGAGVLNELAPPKQRCQDPYGKIAIDGITQSLLSTLPNPAYEFQIVMVHDPRVNAFALPGGYIVLFQGLLERTESPEELAGVLAHEVQHILKRHSMRMLLETTSMGILFAALSGDVSGLMSFGLEAARTLGALSYSRDAEEEADTDGIQMLISAGIDPQGMIAFFTKLEEHEASQPDLFTLLSTHPSSSNRITRLQRIAGQQKDEPPTTLLNYDWESVRSMCARIELHEKS